MRKKISWWNKPLTSGWMGGSLIGFAISVLIASQIARWRAILMAVLGCIFAIAFRLMRNDEEI